jgi:3-oxoacid CoA-transferase
VKQCSLPLTGFQVVDMIITEKCAFQVDYIEGLTLIEIAEGITLDELKKCTDSEFKVVIIFNINK